MGELIERPADSGRTAHIVWTEIIDGTRRRSGGQTQDEQTERNVLTMTPAFGKTMTDDAVSTLHRAWLRTIKLAETVLPAFLSALCEFIHDTEFLFYAVPRVGVNEPIRLRRRGNVNSLHASMSLHCSDSSCCFMPFRTGHRMHWQKEYLFIPMDQK